MLNHRLARSALLSRRVAPAIMALVVVALAAPRARGDDLSEQAFLCEDAVARARNCCPQTFNVSAIRCVYDPPHSEGCAFDPGIQPDIDAATACCIIDATCQELGAGRCNFVLPCP